MKRRHFPVRRCPGCQAVVRGTTYLGDARRRRWHMRCARAALAGEAARRGRPPKALAVPRVVVPEQVEMAVVEMGGAAR